MNIARIKDIIKKIPPGISVGLTGPSIDFGAMTQHFSQLSPEDRNKIFEALTKIKESTEDLFRILIEELQSIGISNKEQIAQLIELIEENVHKQEQEVLKFCFFQVDDVFESEINKNFLLEFDGPNTDYLQLLSHDFRKLFFKFFNQCNRTNENNRICIVGSEGVGKTFNSLLIGKKLEQEGYHAYYCEDIRDAKLSPSLFSYLMGSFDEHSVFIIDNCQARETKAEKIVEKITKAEGYVGKPRFMFLTRPLGHDDIIDIFGKKTPIIEFKERYVNFEYLTELFFRKINLSERLDDFLSSLQQYDLSKTLFKYRNMAFWNEFFRSMEHSRKVEIKETEFYKRANRLLRKREPYLIQSKDVLSKLLPYFMYDIPIHKNYIKERLQISGAQIQKLEGENVIFLKEQDWESKDWENDTAMFIVSKIHPTKAKIIATLLRKYEGTEINVSDALIDYANTYYENLYYLISSFYISGILEELCSIDNFVSVVKTYLKKRHLGKQLDRVIKTISKLEPELKDKLIDDEVLDSLAEKLNDKMPYIVSKVSLFRAMYKFSHLRTYELYERYDAKGLVDDFNNIPNERIGIHSFAKFMEVFKNIYYFADDEEKKRQITNTVKEILDGCFQEFVKRFEKRSRSFTQFHWLLKRLDGMNLSNYFLEKIPPAKVVEWIKSKDTNTVELSKSLLKNAKYTWYTEKNGTQRNYYDYFKNSLGYSDIKRIFDNRRTKNLYNLAINANNQMLADYLYQYSFEDAFVKKVLNTSVYLINKSIGLLEKNIYLSNEQKDFIINRIKVSEK